ncbi:hypothetical protein OAS39_05430 [Pirellulales bacterium]|nr:hypothetical protein [Pirellulales bacterium]
MTRLNLTLFALLILPAPGAYAGPFTSHVGSGVPADQITAWATSLEEYSPTSEVVEFDMFGGGPWNRPVHGLGPANEAYVALGDLDATAIAGGAAPGSITLSFRATIFDGPGDDLAVFENAGTFFDSHSPDFIFAELAHVEVSSNGIHFARFPSTSLNLEVNGGQPDPNRDQLHAPFGREFAGVNTTNIDNLAGVHPVITASDGSRVPTGTPFDLADLANDPLANSGIVDVNNIRFVRLVDIPGDGSFTDSHGNPILDAWKTAESGGFDLDAIGAIYAVPEPTLAPVTLLQFFFGSLLFNPESRRMLRAKR